MSVPTVSRVLSGKVPVSAEKRARVLESIRVLGYRPLAAAQSLASTTPRTLGILVANTRRYGYTEVLEGIEAEARRCGYTPVIHLLSPAEGETVADIVRAAVNARIAGALVVGFDDAACEALTHIPAWVPLVIAGNALPEHSAERVVIDEEPAARALVRHLLDLGHRTVVHVALPPPSGAEDPRTTGWRAELEAAGRPVPPVRHADWDAAAGACIGRELAAEGQATAVFCGNDEVAIGLIHALREEGLRVPEDVSVVGFDDHPLSAYMNPPLTTAVMDFAQMGELACARLLAQLGTTDTTAADGERRPPHAIASATRFRASTAAPPRITEVSA